MAKIVTEKSSASNKVVDKNTTVANDNHTAENTIEQDTTENGIMALPTFASTPSLPSVRDNASANNKPVAHSNTVTEGHEDSILESVQKKAKSPEAETKAMVHEKIDTSVANSTATLQGLKAELRSI